jgi:hypothetical protein
MIDAHNWKSGLRSANHPTTKNMNRPSLDHLHTGFCLGEKQVIPIEPIPEKMVVAEARDTSADRSWNPVSPSIVIVYNDIHAALRAAEAVERLGQKFHDQGRQWLMPVPVAQLDDPSRFDHLLADAHSAEMIIVSFNGAGDFPALLKKWIEDCIAQQTEGHAAVVALLSSNQELDPPDSPRYNFFKNAAWAAGLEYVAPRAEAAEGLPGAERLKAAQ